MPADLLGDLDPLRIVLILLVILGAAVIKGAVGFGFPLVATPLIAAIWDARHAVLLLSLAALFNNIGIVFRGGGSKATFWRLAPTIGGVVVGTVAGALLLASLNPDLLGIVVGALSVVFALVSLVKPDLGVPPRLERFLALPMGLGGGLLAGSTGIGAPFLASYTHALQLGKREFVFFLTLLYLTGSTVQAISYTQLGLYDRQALTMAVLSCVPNVVGLATGIRLQEKINPLLFRRLVVGLILVTGVGLLLKGL